MTTVIAISLAVASAFGLAFGAAFQHQGVSTTHTGDDRFGIRQLVQMFKHRTWVLGLAITVVGVTCGTISLALAPVMVVQPVGAISLVISVLLAQKTRGLHVSKRIVIPVLLSVAGVAAFVIMAALIATAHPYDWREVLPIVWLTVGGIVAFWILRALLPARTQLLYVIGAAYLFACVATNTHIVTSQFLHLGLGAVAWWNLAVLIAAAAVGSIFVQAAYTSGPPELVIAGLTVLDPIIAVIFGATILGEAQNAPWLSVAVMCVTGLTACAGVALLSRYHPDVRKKATLVARSEPPT